MSVFASRSWVYSTSLHVLMAGVLAAVMVRVRDTPSAPPPFIIEWMPTVPTKAKPMETQGVVQTTAASVNFKPVKVIPPPRAALAPQPPAESVEPRPAVTGAPVSAKPADTRPVRTATTIAEHRQLHSAPAATVTATRAPGRRINMDEVLAAAAPSDRVQPVGAADSASEADYWQALLGKLRAAHKRPAGLEDGLQVLVEFVLRADGSVGAVKILQSSGNPEFDTSVVAAFRNMADLGVPPAGKVGVNQVRFRTQAD